MYEPPIRRRTMRAQRRVMFSRLVLAAALLTIVAFFTGYSPVIDVAAIAWFAVVVFVALALYAVSQGYLDDAALKPRLPNVDPSPRCSRCIETPMTLTATLKTRWPPTSTSQTLLRRGIASPSVVAHWDKLDTSSGV